MCSWQRTLWNRLISLPESFQRLHTPRWCELHTYGEYFSCSVKPPTEFVYACIRSGTLANLGQGTVRRCWTNSCQERKADGFHHSHFERLMGWLREGPINWCISFQPMVLTLNKYHTAIRCGARSWQSITVLRRWRLSSLAPGGFY